MPSRRTQWSLCSSHTSRAKGRTAFWPTHRLWRFPVYQASTRFTRHALPRKVQATWPLYRLLWGQKSSAYSDHSHRRQPRSSQLLQIVSFRRLACLEHLFFRAGRFCLCCERQQKITSNRFIGHLQSSGLQVLYSFVNLSSAQQRQDYSLPHKTAGPL